MAFPPTLRSIWTRIFPPTSVIAISVLNFLGPLDLLAGETSSDGAETDWAKERQFWSFHPPVPQARPRVLHPEWPRQTLDYFVLAQLEQKGLAPSRPAEKTALFRRLTLDLTGLPPSPEETRQFLADKRKDAYERQVDRLLRSPRFGERLASLWLPLARYAEDQAHQVGTDTKYFFPNAYKYRDWVIDAFNRDLPYNEFIRLQIAADLLHQTNDLAALGFLGLGPKYYNRERIDVMADEWEDRVDTVSRTVLGLTVACARCHDHKFEPITREDYYGLAGVFASTRMVNRAPDGSDDKAEKAEKMNTATVHMVREGEAHDLNVFIRGNVDRKGPIAPRRLPRILFEQNPGQIAEGSGRLEVAEGLTDPANPLTARVMVNRLFGLFFGRELVETPSNFGHSGSRPANQALLDDLATRFVANHWSIKSLVREIVLSATYRQGSGNNLLNALIDSRNDFLWRMNRRRLSIEQWRDSMLFASGELDLSPALSLDLDNPTNHHRTVFSRISRLQLNALLMQFDYPDANVHAEKRSATTTPLQKLFALNNPFMIERAKRLAETMQKDARETDESRVRRLYLRLFARAPDPLETRWGLEFLARPAPATMSRWDEFAQALLASNEMLYVD